MHMLHPQRWPHALPDLLDAADWERYCEELESGLFGIDGLLLGGLLRNLKHTNDTSMLEAVQNTEPRLLIVLCNKQTNNFFVLLSPNYWLNLPNIPISWKTSTEINSCHIDCDSIIWINEITRKQKLLNVLS